ncbi:hypothetical protein [Aerococcus sanguinicola]|uniref:MucBP domain-containing protein n=1 Tax=Aerococcus sanguinicola TaxID=119206 RepID=A0A0X8FCM4_9LACT|nr:hypothetical protein [Aerococcus sanguinicola]AMB94072.1 hypothetical protein AWM72_04520 [Aerococcus sanguinicola]
MQRQLKQDILKILACSATLCFFLSQEVQAAPLETSSAVQSKENESAPAEAAADRPTEEETPTALTETSESSVSTGEKTADGDKSLQSEKEAESSAKTEKTNPNEEKSTASEKKASPTPKDKPANTAPTASKATSKATANQPEPYRPVVSRHPLSSPEDPSSTPTDQLPLVFQALVKKGLPSDKLINYSYGWTDHNTKNPHGYPKNLAAEQRLTIIDAPSNWSRLIKLSEDQKRLLVTYTHLETGREKKWTISYMLNDQPLAPEKAATLTFRYDLDRGFDRVVEQAEESKQAELPPYQRFSKEGLSEQEAKLQIIYDFDLIGLSRDSSGRYYFFPIQSRSGSPKGRHLIIPERENPSNPLRITFLGPLRSKNDRDMLIGVQNWTLNPQDFGNLRIWRWIDKKKLQEPLEARPGMLEDDNSYFIVESEENPFSEFAYQELPHSPKGASDEELLSFHPLWMGVNWKNVESKWDPILNLPFNQLNYYSIDRKGQLKNKIEWSKFVIPHEDGKQVDLIYQFGSQPALDTKNFKVHWRVSKEDLDDKQTRYHYQQIYHFTDEWAQKKEVKVDPASKIPSDLDFILAKKADDPYHYFAKESQREKIDDQTEHIHIDRYDLTERKVGKIVLPALTSHKEVWRKEVSDNDSETYQIKYRLLSRDQEQVTDGPEKVYTLPLTEWKSEPIPFINTAEDLYTQGPDKKPIDIPNIFNLLPTPTKFEGTNVYPIYSKNDFYLFKSPDKTSGFEAFHYQTEPVKDSSDYLLTITNISGAEDPYNGAQRRYRVQQFGLESPTPFIIYAMKFYTDLDHPERVYRYIGNEFGQGGTGTGGRRVLTKEKPYEESQVKLPDKANPVPDAKVSKDGASKGTDGRDDITKEKPYEKRQVKLPDKANQDSDPGEAGAGAGKGTDGRDDITKDKPYEESQVTLPNKEEDNRPAASHRPSRPGQVNQPTSSSSQHVGNERPSQVSSWLDKIRQSLKDWASQPSQRLAKRQALLASEDNQPKTGSLAQLIQNIQGIFLEPGGSQDRKTARSLSPEDRPLRTKDGLTVKEAIAQLFQKPVQAAEEEVTDSDLQAIEDPAEPAEDTPSAKTEQASKESLASKEDQGSHWKLPSLLLLLILPLAYWWKKRQ